MQVYSHTAYWVVQAVGMIFQIRLKSYNGSDVIIKAAGSFGRSAAFTFELFLVEIHHML